MKTITQNSQIRHDLEAGHKITPLDALRKYSCFRLGARIHELKGQGMKIKSEMKQIDAFTRVAEYSL